MHDGEFLYLSRADVEAVALDIATMIELRRAFVFNAETQRRRDEQ